MGLFLAYLFSNIKVSLACESCLLSRTGRDGGQAVAKNEDSKFFFKYWFEQQQWKNMDLNVAHDLHHDGERLWQRGLRILRLGNVAHGLVRSTGIRVT